MLDKDFHELF